MKLKLNIYGFETIVLSCDTETIDRLQKDFSWFESDRNEIKQTFILEIFKTDPKAIHIGSHFRKSKMCSSTYNFKHFRYNNYNNKALSFIDYKNELAQVYSLDINLLHEISYLLILSRSGKFLDLQGLHKIHAFGIEKNNKILLGNFPMKGGKTTLFLNFIQDIQTSIVSDDTALVSKNGDILPFPLRIGLEDNQTFLNLKNSASNPSLFYELNRMKYGKKYLISTKALINPIFTPTQVNPEIILLKGIKVKLSNPTVASCSKILFFYNLILGMIIGFGLPMIKEYYLEWTFLDFFKLTKIFFSRIRTAIILLKKSQTYTIHLSTDSHKNRIELISKLNFH